MRILAEGVGVEGETTSGLLEGMLLDIGISGGTIALVLVGLFLARKLIERLERSVAGHRFRGQIVMLVLTLLGAVLPLQQRGRRQGCTGSIPRRPAVRRVGS